MVLVLVHNNGPSSGQIHACSGYHENYTLCGERMHPVSSTYTPKLFVTCPKCLARMNDAQLREQLKKSKGLMNNIFAAGNKCGLRVEIEIETSVQAGVALMDFKFIRKAGNPAMTVSKSTG